MGTFTLITIHVIERMNRALQSTIHEKAKGPTRSREVVMNKYINHRVDGICTNGILLEVLFINAEGRFIQSCEHL